MESKFIWSRWEPNYDKRITVNNPAESWFSALSVFRDAFNLGSVKSMIPTQSYKAEESFSTVLYVH